MKFGVYYTFRRNPSTDSSALFSALLEHVETLEDLGYDYALVSEHHFLSDGYLPSALTMLAAFAARTKRIQLGTYVLILPLHHPVRVAEDAAVVDILSGGRLTLGVAAGYRREEFDGLGADRRRRGRVMEDHIGVLRTSWGEGRVDDVTDVQPKPVHSIPIWVGGFAGSAVDRAVRLGNGYMLGGLAVGSADPYDLYLEALSRYGKSQAEIPLIGNRVVYVAETDDEAWTEAGDALLRQHNSYASWFGEASDGRGHHTATSVGDLVHMGYVVGSPETCRRLVEEYAAKYHVDVMTFAGHVPGVPLQGAKRSLELFATEVIPHFQTHS